MDRSAKSIAAAVFLAAFTPYLLTAAPLITAGDAGELVAASFLLGVPHPPGYPLFCLIGRLFSLLPFGNAAYRMNLMSAFFSAVSASLVYLCAMAVARARGRGMGPALGAGAAALAVSFCGLYWGQATHAEVYPLHMAAFMAVVYALIVAARGEDFRHVYLAVFLFSLSLAGHYSSLLLAPGLLFVILYSFRREWDAGRAAVAAALFMFGLSVFVYLPVRAAAGPAVNWGHASGLSSFVAHVTRASYGDVAAFLPRGRLGGMSPAVPAAVAVLALAAVYALFIRRAARAKAAGVLGVAVVTATCVYLAALAVRGVDAEKAGYFLSMSGYGLALLAVPAAAGLAFSYRRDRPAFVLLFLTLAATLVVSLYRIPSGGRATYAAFADKFFLPPLMLAGVLAGIGAASVLAWLSGLPGRWKSGSAALGAALLLLPGWYAVKGFGAMDKSGQYYAHDYASSLIRPLEQGAVFMAMGDNVPSLLSYLKFVEGRRPDMDVFDENGLVFPSFAGLDEVYRRGDRPMYLSEGLMEEFRGVPLVRSGMIAAFPATIKGRTDPWEFYDFREGGEHGLRGDFPTRELIVNYNYFKGMHLVDIGRKQEARALLDRAASVGRDFVWANFWVGKALRDVYGETGEAHALFERVKRLSPDFAEGYLELGRTRMMGGDMKGAVRALKAAEKLSPDNPEIKSLLAEIYAGGPAGPAGE